MDKSEDATADKLRTIKSPVFSYCSITGKAINRDAADIIGNNKLPFSGVIVADGIGHHERVEEASRFVVDFLKDHMEQLGNIEDVGSGLVFESCKIAFDKKFGTTISNQQFGTTAIIAMEYIKKGRSRITAAYVGNGAIWHIKGNFSHFSENQKIPWNSVNYLNPHSIEQNGKEALYNCISLGDKNYSGPSCIDLSCDTEFGDIIMICTDGIYSYDQLVCSEDGFGEIWIHYSLRMTMFYKYLADYFKLGDCNNERLEKMLKDYLNELKEKNLLDDDATLGLIISAKAIEYQKKLYDEPADKN